MTVWWTFLPCSDWATIKAHPYAILDLGLLVALGVGRLSSKLVFKSIARGSAARIERQLAEDRLDMPTDCVRAQHKALGDLFVAESQSK
jgi:hypothetical protein